MAMLGKEVRMSRLVNPESKKMMAITVDHAISRGIAPKAGCYDHDKGNRGTLHVALCRKGGPFDEGIKLFPGIAYQGHYIRVSG